MGTATATKAQTAEERYILRARDAGITAEQLINLRRGEYAPLPWALPVHAVAREADADGGPVWILTGGARGPGKSHQALAQVAVDDCQRRAGLKFLFLRKTKLSASESFDDLVRKVCHSIPHDYTASEGRLQFPNGSRVLIGGYQYAKDIDKYLSIEYDGAIIEELANWMRDR